MFFSLLALDDKGYKDFDKPPCTFNHTFTTAESVHVFKYDKVFMTEGVCVESQVQNLLLVMNEFKGCQIYAEFYDDVNFTEVKHYRILDDKEDWESFLDFNGYYGRVWIKPLYTTRIYFKGIVLPQQESSKTQPNIYVSNLNVNDIYLSKDAKKSQFEISQSSRESFFLLFPSAYSKYELSYDLGEGEFVDVIKFGRHQKRLTKTGNYSFQCSNSDPQGYFIYHPNLQGESSYLHILSSIQTSKLIGYNNHEFEPTIPVGSFITTPYLFKKPTFGTGVKVAIAIVVIIICLLLGSCLLMSYFAKKRPPPPKNEKKEVSI